MKQAIFLKQNQLVKPPDLYWLMWAVALGVPFFLWLNHTGNPLDYFRYNAPAGQIWYLFSKLFGLLSASLLLMQIGLMLAAKNRTLNRWSIHAHQNLGLLTFACIFIHGGCFIAAKSVRGGHFAYQTLIPDFTNGFYNSAVSFGVIAFFCILLTVATGLLRQYQAKFIGATWLHKLGIVAAVLVLIHCWWIGSDLINSI